jgi:hypothetical protein
LIEPPSWIFVPPLSAFADPMYALQPNVVPAGESIVWALPKEHGLEPGDAAGNTTARAPIASTRYLKSDTSYEGVGSVILLRCESEAASMGYTRFALMATLPGVKFHLAHGYVAGEPRLHSLGNGSAIQYTGRNDCRGLPGAIPARSPPPTCAFAHLLGPPRLK